jgi:hypothetical protein
MPVQQNTRCHSKSLHATLSGSGVAECAGWRSMARMCRIMPRIFPGITFRRVAPGLVSASRPRLSQFIWNQRHYRFKVAASSEDRLLEELGLAHSRA